MITKYIIEAGMRFCKLTVVGDPFMLNTQRSVKCICDCGSERFVAVSKLANGYTKSCGCRRKIGLATRHGGARRGNKPPEYSAWLNIKSRCYNKNLPYYHRYGGRGIVVCDRWLGKDGYKNFISDMGNKPSSKHSLDRINNNGNYEPGNCRWATWYEQATNKGDNRILEYKGRRLSQSEWAKELGVTQTTLYHLRQRKSFAECVEYYLNKQKRAA